MGPGQAASGRPSILAIGSTPPPVELRKTSSAPRDPPPAPARPEGNGERAAQLDHGLARDALEHAAVGGAHHAVLDHEDVEARAFGDVALGVDDAAGVGATVVGVEHREHQVHPVVVLDRRIDRFGRDPDPPADVQVDALGLLLGRGDPDEGQRVGVEAIGRQARIAGAARRHAAGADHRHVGIVEAAGADAAVQDLPHLGAAVGDLHAQLVEAGEEPVEVVVETEERALPGADDVVGDVRAGEAPVEHRDLGFRQRLPVAVDEHRSALELAPRHRSHAVPSNCSRREIAIGAAAVSIRRSARARRRPIARVALRCRPHQELRCSKP